MHTTKSNHSLLSNAIKGEFMRYFQKNPHRMCSVKIYVLKNFANSTGKKPILESLFNKVAGLQACIFIKKRFQHRCFPVNIAKSLRGPILK